LNSIQLASDKHLLQIDKKIRYTPSRMDSHTKPEVASFDEGKEELLAELAKEVARNHEAIRLVKEKELQAFAARDRAADSQRRMQEMVQKYENMKTKLEWTRVTLDHTANQIGKHENARAEHLRQTVTRLKERADNCSEMLRKKRERDEERELEEREAKKMSSSNSDQINNDDNGLASSGDDCALTETEKMLLLLCQNEASENNKEIDNTTEIHQEQQKQCTLQTDTHIQEDSTTSAEPIINSEQNAPKSENENAFDATSSDASSSLNIQENSSNIGGNTEKDHEHANKESNEHSVEVCHAEHKTTCTSSNTDDLTDNISCTEKVEGAGVSDDFDLKEATKDLNETVTTIQAKCAGVREELGQMAMSEQYMRTKQAQLLAKRREKEATEALAAATEKEKEAQEMRQKVANMMKLLEERRSKLKVTENVLEKKANVVDKVNNLMEGKIKHADFVQKQRDEYLLFSQSLKDAETNAQRENSSSEKDTDVEKVDESPKADKEDDTAE